MEKTPHIHLNRTTALLVSFLVSFVIILIDVNTPPPIRLNTLFVVPVLIVAWYNGFRWAFAFSVGLPIVRLLVAVSFEPIVDVAYNITNALHRMLTLGVISYVVARLSMSQLRLRTIEALLPICQNCASIRNAGGEWKPLETYLTQNIGTMRPPTLCPKCARKTNLGEEP